MNTNDLINRYKLSTKPIVSIIYISQALRSVDRGLYMQPDNAQLLKLKGDILKDLHNMSEAEKVM